LCSSLLYNKIMFWLWPVVIWYSFFSILTIWRLKSWLLEIWLQLFWKTLAISWFFSYSNGHMYKGNLTEDITQACRGDLRPYNPECFSSTLSTCLIQRTTIKWKWSVSTKKKPPVILCLICSWLNAINRKWLSVCLS